MTVLSTSTKIERTRTTPAAPSVTVIDRQEEGSRDDCEMDPVEPVPQSNSIVSNYVTSLDGEERDVRRSLAIKGEREKSQKNAPVKGWDGGKEVRTRSERREVICAAVRRPRPTLYGSTPAGNRGPHRSLRVETLNQR